MALNPAIVQELQAQLEIFKDTIITLLNNRVTKNGSATNSTRFENRTYAEFVDEIEGMINDSIEEFDENTVAGIRQQINSINVALGTRPTRAAAEIISGNWTMYGVRTPIVPVAVNAGNNALLNVASGAGIFVIEASGPFLNVDIGTSVSLINGTSVTFRIRVISANDGMPITFQEIPFKLSQDGQPWPDEVIRKAGMHEFELSIYRLANATSARVTHIGSSFS